MCSEKPGIHKMVGNSERLVLLPKNSRSSHLYTKGDLTRKLCVSSVSEIADSEG